MALPSSNFRFELGAVGYFSRLGLEYGAPASSIAKAYRRAALAAHPDHAAADVPDDGRASDVFQELQTARAILSDEDCRAGYERILLLRTLLHQRDDAHAEIDPWLAYSLVKINRKQKRQVRIVTFDFVTRTVSNWNKDVIRKTFHFEQITDVAEIGTTKFQMTVRVAGTDEEREYLYESQTPRTNAAVCRILRGIRNDDLIISRDDRVVPERSYLKGPVAKKKVQESTHCNGVAFADVTRATQKTAQGPSLRTTWVTRSVMIGASNILVFRDAQFKSLVQCIAHRDLQVPPAPVEGAQAQALTLRWDKTSGPGSKDPAITMRFDTVDKYLTWLEIIRRVVVRAHSATPPRPGDLLLSPIRNAKSDPWSGPEPLRIEYAVHPLPEANGAASSNANDSAVDAVVVAALSDEDSSVSEASSNGHAHGDDDEISSNTDTRSHTNDNTGLERNTNGGIAYQARRVPPSRVKSNDPAPVVRDEAVRGVPPVRIRSEPAVTLTTRPDPNGDENPTLILQLVTVREEINNLRRRLHLLQKHEKELMVERERQSGLAQHRTGFLSDIASKMKSLFSNQSTYL
ncbi:J domain-containing protein [Plasmodiophora brassicae]|uniref:J domain-containing protein n=1 Tax=Plasmodiophora brassicae TaxID=37360 RepID=A0A0G4ILH4_PLABS|nr:hypothetical protein PBRA_004709 [Plasmodiophora brassicae]